MADELRMALTEVLRKAGVEQADFLREGVRVLAQAKVSAAFGQLRRYRRSRPRSVRQQGWDERRPDHTSTRVFSTLFEHRPSRWGPRLSSFSPARLRMRRHTIARSAASSDFVVDEIRRRPEWLDFNGEESWQAQLRA